MLDLCIPFPRLHFDKAYLRVAEPYPVASAATHEERQVCAAAKGVRFVQSSDVACRSPSEDPATRPALVHLVVIVIVTVRAVVVTRALAEDGGLHVGRTLLEGARVTYATFADV